MGAYIYEHWILAKPNPIRDHDVSTCKGRLEKTLYVQFLKIRS